MIDQASGQDDWMSDKFETGRGQLTRKTERGQYPALIEILLHRFRENFLRDTTGVPERAS